MIVKIEESLDDYVDMTDATTSALRKENGPILRVIREYHRYFAETLWRDADALHPVAAILSVNAFMLYLAGLRVALTGHVAAVFPVLRTALESACYGFLIAKNAELADVWSNRHKDDVARKACRKAFTAAVGDVAKQIDAEQEGGGQWIADAYELAIDFGGHPNIKAVVGHLSVQEDTPDDPNYRLNLAGLYGADHWETKRILIGCLDYALAIAVVLTRALDAPDEEHQKQLQTLNDRKNALCVALEGDKLGEFE